MSNALKMADCDEESMALALGHFAVRIWREIPRHDSRMIPGRCFEPVVFRTTKKTSHTTVIHIEGERMRFRYLTSAARWWKRTFLLAAGIMFVQWPNHELASQDSDLGGVAIQILRRNCGSAGCHAGPDPYSFDVGDPATLVSAGVIVPGDPAGSELIRRIESGAMPLGGYQGRPGTKLPLRDIDILRRWIAAGGPRATTNSAARRPFMHEADVLRAITRDLESASPRDRLYFRYFSLANLWNSASVDALELASYRLALGKLLNHLSWEPRIVMPEELGVEKAVLRIDLRDFGWTTAIWQHVVSSYPYGIVHYGREKEARSLPYIRVDWFISRASVPPLYHDILRLPHTLEDLEDMLRLDSEFQVRHNLAARFGLRNSGVSRNNRAMERHATVYGAYWKSFDFSGNSPEQNVFRNPLELRSDGGEVIFNLPNGLQAYFIADSRGRRIDEAPVNIVRDKTNPDDPVVRNGRSCIACHVSGLNAFRDEIRATIQARPQALFNIDQALALYPGQRELERFLETDNGRFGRALKSLGNNNSSLGPEPMNSAARRYEAVLTFAQAAAEMFIEDPARLQQAVQASTELQAQGFDQLLGPRGGIKRDAWELGFGIVAQQLGIGEPVCPVEPFQASGGLMIFSKKTRDSGVLCSEGGRQNR
jgi:hypothetical protein